MVLFCVVFVCLFAFVFCLSFSQAKRLFGVSSCFFFPFSRATCKGGNLRLPARLSNRTAQLQRGGNARGCIERATCRRMGESRANKAQSMLEHPRSAVPCRLLHGSRPWFYVFAGKLEPRLLYALSRVCTWCTSYTQTDESVALTVCEGASLRIPAFHTCVIRRMKPVWFISWRWSSFKFYTRRGFALLTLSRVHATAVQQCRRLERKGDLFVSIANTPS